MTADEEKIANERHGRMIRFALMTLPIGTIILGIASFGIWQWKKDRVQRREIEHALALRQPVSASSIARYLAALKGLPPEGREHLNGISSYVDSATSAENMGYESRRTFDGDARDALSAVEVELTGDKRPREVVLLLVMPGSNAAAPMAETNAIAGLLALAHEMTGERTLRTIRFGVVPATGLTAPDSLLQRMLHSAGERRERFLQVITLGPEPTGIDLPRLFEAEQRGVRIDREPVPLEPDALVDWLLRLKKNLLAQANAP